MVVRNPGNDTKLVQDQYCRLKDAVESFYAGKDVQALNIAVTIRVLLHETSNSKSLLSRLHSDYWNLTIYDKPPLAPKTIFALRTPLVISGDGTKRIIRPQFDSDLYQLVPLNRWWSDEYQPLGTLRLSKREIVLNVAHKDGGAHIDGKVPDHHATLSEPPFLFEMDNGGEKHLMQPNMAYGIAAQAGCELQDYLERHFRCS
jgi:hypothetical protein